MNVPATTACDLCGLEVGHNPLFVFTKEKAYNFCCEGCVGIFRMINVVEEVAEGDCAQTAPRQTGD